MTARALLLAVALLLPLPAQAKVLPFTEVFQEQGQWCWAAVTRSILLYYGHDKRQCDIAEYARTVSTLRDLGKVNCCTDPSQGCDKWHYYGKTPGSVADNLNHFGSLKASGLEKPVTDAEVDSEINKHGRPLVVRWKLASGNGHFVVAHGLTSGVLAYMNPFPGEGKKVAALSWIRDNGAGQLWTHTVYLTTPCRCTKKGPCCDGCQHLAAGTACAGGTCQLGACVASPDAAIPDASPPDLLATPDAAPPDAAAPDAGAQPPADEGCSLAGTAPPTLPLHLLFFLIILRAGRRTARP